jgi:hypothetical protein
MPPRVRNGPRKERIISTGDRAARILRVVSGGRDVSEVLDGDERAADGPPTLSAPASGEYRHILIWDERQLPSVLQEYTRYYQAERTHMALERNAPLPRVPASRPAQELSVTPALGGLHHRYRSAA